MNAFWFSLFFSSESFWRRCISFTVTSFHEWSLFFSFSNVDVCIRRSIMLATYFSLLHKLFDLALLFHHDKSTLLAIISESALLQFMQFIVVYSSSRFILLWLYCSFQKFALRALWLFSYSNMLRSFLNLKVMMITTEFTKKNEWWRKIDYSRFVQWSELLLQETENSILYKLKNWKWWMRMK